jgi:long-subunit fatty acid transport protein
VKEKKNFRFYVGSFVFIVFVNASVASANVGEVFGFGSRTMSLGGAGVSGGAESYSSYHNPAALSMDTYSDKRLQFNFGVVAMTPNFSPITNVVTSNSFVADNSLGSPTYGDVDTTSYRPTLGQEMGLSYRLFPEIYNLTIGIATFLPLNQVAYMDTGETYQPEYVLYRARTQRPQVSLGAGAHLGNGFHVGAGLNFAFSLTADAVVFINTKPNSASSMKFASSVKPNISPYLGFFYSPPEFSRVSLGAVIRLPSASDATMSLKSGAQVLGPLGGLDFNFVATSAIYYDPWAFELGGAWALNPGSKFYWQVDYQLWSLYQPPALLVAQGSVTKPPSTTIAPGSVPALSYTNILIPRVGEEISLSDDTTLRLGYAYRRSFLTDVSGGAGNYLDPSKHMLSMGLGIRYKHILGIEVDSRLDFNLSYHALVAQHVTKTAGNEKGELSDVKIGSPGYDVGGKIWGGGVTLSLAL